MTDAVIAFAATGLPEPLVPPGTDLSAYPYMPLYLERLRRSKAWLRAKRRPELGFYMFNLWAWSWHEFPAGSIEDDDDVLADAAMCDPARWDEVRDEVLRGWIRCSDGRLYHPVVAELVHEVLGSQQQASDKARRIAIKRWGTRRHRPAPDACASPQQCTSIAPAMLRDAKGDGKGEVEGEQSSPSGFSDEKPTGEGCAPAREGPPPPEFCVPQEWIEDARRRRHDLGLPAANLPVEAEKFAGRHRAGRLPRGDPRALWDEWVLKELVALLSPAAAAFGSPDGMPDAATERAKGQLAAAFWDGFPDPGLVRRESQWTTRLRGWAQKPSGWWAPNWGPRPDSPDCEAPATMRAWALEKSRAPPGGAAESPARAEA